MTNLDSVLKSRNITLPTKVCIVKAIVFLMVMYVVRAGPQRRQFSRSVVSNFATPWTAAHQASLSITNSWSLLRLISIKSVMPSNHSSSVIPFSCLQSFPASGSFQMSQFFTSGGQSIGSFSFSISPSNEYSGLISFRIDLLDILAVQGTLKCLLHHHSSKASVL